MRAHPLRTALLAVLPLITTSATLAGKPSRNAPERTAIVNAVRQLPAFARPRGTQLDIRRIWASERWGYLCMLLVDKNGQYARSDEAYEVYQIVLKREPANEGGDGREAQRDKWTPVAHIDGLSQSLRQVQCASDAHGDVTDTFLEGVASNPKMSY